MKVKNMLNSRGNAVPNQFRIDHYDEDAGGSFRYFQSYDSIIVKVVDGKVYLDVRYWNYSKTTSRYRNLFLGETTRQIEAKIVVGEYRLVNLN